MKFPKIGCCGHFKRSGNIFYKTTAINSLNYSFLSRSTKRIRKRKKACFSLDESVGVDEKSTPSRFLINHFYFIIVKFKLEKFQDCKR